MSNEEDDLNLSATTLSALQEFLVEKDARLKRFEELQNEAEKKRRNRAEGVDDDDDEDSDSKDTGASQPQRSKDLTMQDFEADWNASQFWYDNETAQLLADELTSGVTKDTVIGCVSSPSVFVKVKDLIKEGKVPKCEVHLFEYDTRFELFEEFVYYDFQAPLKLPPHLKGRFDRVLVDPPFLSEDCQTKAALTVRWLVKKWSSTDNSDLGQASSEKTRIMVCTGERMQTLVEKVYKSAGVRCTALEVHHAQGLSNEFRCYSSFESDRIHWMNS